MELIKKLNKIQQGLKAPKNQKNTFGNYNYRSCEDILEAVKPLLDGAVILISDDMVQLGERYYIKATATLKDGEKEISNTAFAREANIKKGMDEAQITGSASSYARKYALNGLFCIDDTKDADTMDNRKQPVQKSTSKSLLWDKIKKETGKDNPNVEEIIAAVEDLSGIKIKTKEELTEQKCKGILEMCIK